MKISWSGIAGWPCLPPATWTSLTCAADRNSSINWGVPVATSLNGQRGNISRFAATVIWLVCDLRKLDVLTLGRSTAITLGVNYKWVVLRSLMIVSILASASTVLVGPVTFLGILIVSIARFIFPTYRHIVLMPGTALVGVAALTFGMLLTERWLNFSVPLSVIINFVGGVYFIYLIMKIKRI